MLSLDILSILLPVLLISFFALMSFAKRDANVASWAPPLVGNFLHICRNHRYFSCIKG
jgi:hypothetical protein